MVVVVFGPSLNVGSSNRSATSSVGYSRTALSCQLYQKWAGRIGMTSFKRLAGTIVHRTDTLGHEIITKISLPRIIFVIV